MTMSPISYAKALALNSGRAMSLNVKQLRFFLTILCLFVVTPALPAEQQTQIGPVSRLPIPRFVSLKSDRVNLHEGPSKDHRTMWVYERAGLPVEITAEFETWRKIRDSEGTEGWVLHSLLSGRRTALVAPWKKEPLLLFAKDHTTAVSQALARCRCEFARLRRNMVQSFGSGFRRLYAAGKSVGRLSGREGGIGAYASSFRRRTTTSMRAIFKPGGGSGRFDTST